MIEISLFYIYINTATSAHIRVLIKARKELINVFYLSVLTEKHSEDSVWRRHHQQRGFSGEFDEINTNRSGF